MDTRLYRKEEVRGISVALGSVDDAVIDQVIEASVKAPRVYFTGAGRSFLMIKAMAMIFMQVGKTAYVTGDVTTPAIREGDLLIAASCSGTTKSVVLFLKQAKEEGAKIILITSNPDSAGAKLADIVVTMAADPEPGSAQEGWIADCRFEHAIVPLGDCFAEAIARAFKDTDHVIEKNHANIE